MTAFFGKRLAYSLISLFGLLVLVFFLSRLTGNPADVLLPPDASAAERQAFSERHGFDEPIHIQFLQYLSDLLRLDFGESLRQNRSAMEVALNAYPTTLQLAGLTMVLATTAALLVGALAAIRPGGLFDKIASVFSLTGASTPDFWVAIVAVLVFAVGLGLVPTSGTGTPMHWILPIAVLFLRPFGLLVQIVRGAMISALASPYVKTALAKGVRDRRIVFAHAMRNSLLPTVTVAGDVATGLINGAVVIETVFGFPGIGKLMIDAIHQRDFAVVQATILITACAIFIMNIVIDIIYAILDPRIRYQS
ncbi:MAG TPA: ABC transporter permease [Devosiaceae bacterium]|jgi:peptide/nickel transport system permease protein|nr:ABC transporter permease [Devosiaceae bacterium]